MFNTNELVLFLIPTLLLNITPGPDMIFVLNRGLNFGRTSAMQAVFGIWLGYLFHVALVTLGLASLIKDYPRAFIILKILGAIYLATIGIKTIFEKTKTSSKSLKENMKTEDGRDETFKKSILVSLLNPKVAVFFLAYLPQFVHPGSTSLKVQLFTLGFIFSVSASFVNGCVAMLSALIAKWIKERHQRIMNKIGGGLMVGFAGKILWT